MLHNGDDGQGDHSLEDDVREMGESCQETIDPAAPVERYGNGGSAGLLALNAG